MTDQATYPRTRAPYRPLWRSAPVLAALGWVASTAAAAVWLWRRAEPLDSTRPDL